MEVVIRRISPNIFVRIYNGWQVGAAAALGLCGVGSFLFALYPPQNFSFYAKLVTILLCISTGILVAYLRGRQKLLPPIIIDELSEENSYKATFCTHNNLREADEMTRPLFGRDFIPFDQIEQWRLKNEKGFIQITNAEGVLCACFVILGLKHSFLDEFLTGRLTEHDIDNTVILPFESMKKEERIYISGVVVRDPGSFMGRKRAAVMLWVILVYIKKILGLRKSRLFYAVGLTSDSEKLLKNIGFDICGNKKNRKDKSNLYRIELDKKNWEELVTRLGDYSRMVSFDITCK